MPRSDARAPGWSTDGHRSKHELAYGRGPAKVWVYGALRVRDGQARTLTAPSRHTAGERRRREAIAAAKPCGELSRISAHLASHTRAPMQEWLAAHPRVHHVFLPVGACWLNVQAGWWRLLRRDALAGHSFVDDAEIAEAVQLATAQLNRRAKPWVWGRPPKPHRHLRRCFVYRI